MSVAFWHTRRLVRLIIGYIYSLVEAPLAPPPIAFRSILLRPPGSRGERRWPRARNVCQKIKKLRYCNEESRSPETLRLVLASAIFRLRPAQR